MGSGWSAGCEGLEACEGSGEVAGPWPAGGEQFAGQGDDLAPDLVLGVAVQGQVAQAGVFGGADPVLAAGPAAVP